MIGNRRETLIGAASLAALAAASPVLAATTAARPFSIDVPDAVLADLKSRLLNTRWPDEIPDTGWDYGTNTTYLKELVEYWANDYDWRARERTMNQFAQYKANILGTDIHFIHIKGRKPNSIPILMMHGWPSSFVQFLKIIPLLTDPAAHGMPDAPSFDVVVPSLPGYGFSQTLLEPGFAIMAMAERFIPLMTDVLGYERFALRGSDIGGSVAHQIALMVPEKIIGAHVSGALRGVDYLFPDPQPPVIKAYVEAQAAWAGNELGYARMHVSKPQTLANALNDSPTGLASWIIEKFQSWPDTKGDIESSFTKDELIDNLMVYWVSSTIGSSMRLYYAFAREPRIRGRQDVPTAALMAKHDMVPVPREVAEAFYDLRRYNEADAGGHFLEWEEPELVATDMQAFFAELD